DAVTGPQARGLEPAGDLVRPAKQVARADLGAIGIDDRDPAWILLRATPETHRLPPGLVAPSRARRRHPGKIVKRRSSRRRTPARAAWPTATARRCPGSAPGRPRPARSAGRGPGSR